MKTSFLACLILAGPAHAQDMMPVAQAFALDEKVSCIAHREGWIMNSTGPCKDYKPPARIALGETFYVEGKPHQIRIIIADKITSDYHGGGGADLIKGEIHCTASEEKEQIGGYKPQSTWLYIRRCVPGYFPGR